MNYVVDASVALKWVIDEADSDRARQFRDDFRNGSHFALAPDFFPTECGHAIFRAERKRLITPGQGALLLADLLLDCPQLRVSLPLVARAASIASTMPVGFYDAIYLALAEQEDCEFVTADVKLVNHCSKVFPFVTDLASFL
jgi:predicted nucleic acid-binding protein